MFWPVKSHRVYLFACLFIHLEDLKKTSIFVLFAGDFAMVLFASFNRTNMMQHGLFNQSMQFFSCFIYLYRNGLMSHVSSVVSFSSIGNFQWIRDFAGRNLLSKGISLSLSFMENYYYFFLQTICLSEVPSFDIFQMMLLLVNETKKKSFPNQNDV